MPPRDEGVEILSEDDADLVSVFDQQHAMAMELLRNARTFVLSTVDEHGAHELVICVAMEDEDADSYLATAQAGIDLLRVQYKP